MFGIITLEGTVLRLLDKLSHWDLALVGGFSFSLLSRIEALDDLVISWFWPVSFRGLQYFICFLKASTTTKASKSPAKVGDGGSSSADFKMVSSGLTENQLQLSVEVSPGSSEFPRLGEKR